MLNGAGLSRREPESALETFGISGPYLAVDDARRPLAVERVKHLLRGDPAHVLPRLSGHPSRMRAREHIIELKQRMLRRWRLFGPHVDTCARNQLLVEGIHQRGFIMDEAPRRRNEISVRLHQRELSRPDHTPAFFGERTGDGDVIRAAEQL